MITLTHLDRWLAIVHCMLCMSDMDLINTQLLQLIFQQQFRELSSAKSRGNTSVGKLCRVNNLGPCMVTVRALQFAPPSCIIGIVIILNSSLLGWCINAGSSSNSVMDLFHFSCFERLISCPATTVINLSHLRHCNKRLQTFLFKLKMRLTSF